MITAEHLSRSFSGNGLKLRDLNFHIEKGDCVGLIGPNGSGKRSLMRLILGIYNPDHGRLWVMGKNPSLICRTPLQMSRIDRNRMTFILPESLPDERVSEIVSPKKNAIFDADDFLKECFETLKLSALLSSKVHQLSRGELARVRFYEAITSMPELLLLYEPFVGVDAAMKEQMIRILLTMNQKYSTTILLAVQNLNDMDKICTRAIVLDKGICIYSGDLSDLRWFSKFSMEFPTFRIFQYNDSVGMMEIWKSLSILNQFGQRTLLIMSCTPASRLKYLFTNRRSKIYSAYYIQAKRRIRYE